MHYNLWFRIIREIRGSYINCTRTPFPVVHGGYSTTYFGETQPYTFEFWAIKDPEVQEIDLFSNFDFGIL